jgi:nucleoside-diphosphate-sugar epimerase
VKVLLTGATGFIGSQLTQRLVAEGHQVAILVRPESSLEILQTVLPQIQVHVYDGSYASLVQALGLAQPELVIHVASFFLAQHKSSDIDGLISSNVLFGAHLLEAMDQSGVKLLVNTGTSWQNYKGPLFNPVNLYAATKQAFEDIIHYYSEARELRVVTLRLFDTYGAGDPRLKLLPLLKRAAITGETLEMSPGEQMVDLVHVDDVVDCFVAAGVRLEQGAVRSNEVYAVCSGEPISLRDLVGTLSQMAGKKLNVKWGVRPYRKREVMHPWTPGCTLPGWSPRISLAVGLRAYIES